MIDEQPKKEHWVERSVLDQFTKLTHRSDKERVKAGCELIKHLNQYGTELQESKEFKYALERLIRGLGSSRVLARSGFFIALVALLTNNSHVDANLILEMMQKELHTSGSDSKSEKGDIHMGQILVCGAILRSSCADNCTPETIKQIIEIISSSAKQKSYLSLVAYTFLIDFVNKISQELFTSSVWPVLKAEVGKTWQEQSIDTIHFLFITHKKFPEVVKQKFIKKHLHVDDLICAESMHHIAELLINTLRLSTLKHPFYELFCTELGSTDFVVPFWSEIDKYLSKPNENREIVATTILTYLLSHVDRLSVVSELFIGNYLQSLFYRLKIIYNNHKHELNVKNINLFAILAERFSDENVKSKTKIKVIKSLILHPGDLSFEKITGTKTIQKITSSLDYEGVKKLAAVYRDIILTKLPKNNPKYPTWTIYERVYAAQLFSKLLNLNCILGEQDWKIEQIKFLMNLGIFISNDGINVSNEQEIIVGSSIASSIKDCFYGVLAHKQKNLDDLRQLLNALIEHSNSIILNKDDLPLRNPFTDEDLECWKEMSDFITKLRSIDEKETNIKVKKIISVFQILSIHMGFQLFKDPEMARSSLKELETCFERFRVLGSQKHKKRKSLNEGDEVSDEPEWMEVVVDLILNILSHDSLLLRNVITCVFPHLCPYLNNTVIHQILTVLDPKSEENPLSRFADSDSEDSNEDSEQEEAMDEEHDIDEDDEDNEEEMSEGSDPESDDNENDTVNDKLRMAISQALGNASDQESIDLDDIDEEEGQRLDKALGEAFKLIKKSSRKSKKQNRTDKSLTNFRTRVLDLILIYLNNEPSMYICLEIMLPLFQILEFAITDSHQSPLQVKVQTCIRTLCNVKKFSSTEGVTEELLFNLLNSLLNNDATSTINVARNKENADCCTFIVKCSILINQADNTKPLKNGVTPIVDLYKDQLLAFFTRRDNHLPVTFFSNVLSIVWCGNWALVPICVEQAFNTDIRALRRAFGLKLLQVFYQNNRTLLNASSKRATKILKSIETDLSQKIASIATSNEEHANEHFFQQLIILLTLIKKYHKMDKAPIPDMMDWDSVKESVQNLRKNIKLSNSTKSFFNKYCAMLGINFKLVNGTSNSNENVEDKISQTTQKMEQDDIDQDSEQEVKNSDEKEVNTKKESKKRQKNKAHKKDKMQLKKQAKLLRLQASNEGLEEVTFSKLQMDTAENDSDSELSSEESKNESAQEIEESVEPTPKRKKRKGSLAE